MPTTPPTRLSPENSTRQKYLQLVLKSLAQVKDGTPVSDLTFNKEEVRTIVESLKPLIEKVDGGISPEESTAIFKSRLERLSKGDKSEWRTLRDMIEVFVLLITRAEVFGLHELSLYFQVVKS